MLPEVDGEIRAKLERVLILTNATQKIELPEAALLEHAPLKPLCVATPHGVLRNVADLPTPSQVIRRVAK